MFIDPVGQPDFKNSVFNAVVVPRPIGWVSTLDADGVANLAPFSYFNGVSASPPMVMFGCNAAHMDGGDKDTLRNVRASGEFVVSLATWALRHAVVTSGVRAPRGVDEFALAGLAKAASLRVKPPRVAATPVALECRLLQVVELPSDEHSGQRNQVVFGRVVGFHIDDALFDEKGRVDICRARPLARLGGFHYTAVSDMFDLHVPAWPIADAPGPGEGREPGHTPGAGR